jgi:hypothetical protein
VMMARKAKYTLKNRSMASAGRSISQKRKGPV